MTDSFASASPPAWPRRRVDHRERCIHIEDQVAQKRGILQGELGRSRTEEMAEKVADDEGRMRARSSDHQPNRRARPWKALQPSLDACGRTREAATDVLFDRGADQWRQKPSRRCEPFPACRCCSSWARDSPPVSLDQPRKLETVVDRSVAHLRRRAWPCGGDTSTRSRSGRHSTAAAMHASLIVRGRRGIFDSAGPGAPAEQRYAYKATARLHRADQHGADQHGADQHGAGRPGSSRPPSVAPFRTRGCANLRGGGLD